MGGVLVKEAIYRTFVEATAGGVELFHGYTYSGHPMASAAAVATLDLYRDESLFARAQAMAPYFEEALHSLQGAPNVIDIRNLGLIGVVEVAARDGKVGARGFDVFLDCFQNGVMVRPAGDALAFSPPLVVEKAHVDRMVETLGAAIRRVA
jgi:beta-alanine--pyruvate transaminase